MKLICGITTKNEEWIIKKTLSVLTIFCDKIVILDDNSNDKTEEICKSFEKVEWNSQIPGCPSFIYTVSAELLLYWACY